MLSGWVEGLVQQKEVIPRWYQEGYRANAVIVNYQKTPGAKLIEHLVALCT